MSLKNCAMSERFRSRLLKECMQSKASQLRKNVAPLLHFVSYKWSNLRPACLETQDCQALTADTGLAEQARFVGVRRKANAHVVVVVALDCLLLSMPAVLVVTAYAGYLWKCGASTGAEAGFFVLTQPARSAVSSFHSGP